MSRRKDSEEENWWLIIMWGWDGYFWVVDGERLCKGKKRERERERERTGRAHDLAPS